MKYSANIFRGKTLLQGDPVIWTIFIILCLISIIEVYSASSSMTYKSGAFWRPVVEHAGYIFIGFLATLVIHKIPCRYFKSIPLVMLPVSAFLLAFTLTEDKVNNASRWVGVAGITFQTSEIAKWTLVIYTALILSNMQTENGASKQAFKYILIPTAIFLLMIVSENFSTAGMIFLVIAIMMYVGRVPWKQLGTLLGAILIAGGSFFFTLKYMPDSVIQEVGKQPGLHRLVTWSNRIKNHTDMSVDAKKYQITDENTQTTHAKIAIATSNLIGKGPGNSVERDFLPQPFSDFIYAIILEEMGLLGGIFVMLLYLFLLFRCSQIANRCERAFPAFLVMGLAIMIVLQAMINMAVAVGAFPVTGQPLPLISKGGTATIMNCVYIGMILSVSRTSKKRSNLPDYEPVEAKTEQEI